MPPELSVIIPCYKERANVRPLVSQLAAALAGLTWEAVFVDDDSPDGTAAEIRAIAATDTSGPLHPPHRPPRPVLRRGGGCAVLLRPLHRRDRRGPPARRDPPAGPARRRARRGGHRGRQPARARRRLVRPRRRLAPPHLRRWHPARPAHLPGHAARPDERLLPAPPPPVRTPGPTADRPGLQDPARPHPLRPHPLARDRDRLPVPPSRRRAQQARRAGAAPVRRPAAGQGDARAAAAALRLLRAGRCRRRGGAPGRADRRPL